MGTQGSVTRLIIDLRCDEPAVREVAARLAWGRYFKELLVLARNHRSARTRRPEDACACIPSPFKVLRCVSPVASLGTNHGVNESCQSEPRVDRPCRSR